MRSPLAVLTGRIAGFHKSEIVRRTVPCYKTVIEPDGERLALCVLVDSLYLYRWPHEDVRGTRALTLKAGLLKREMEHLRLREFQPGLCRYASRPGQPAGA